MEFLEQTGLSGSLTFPGTAGLDTTSTRRIDSEVTHNLDLVAADILTKIATEAWWLRIRLSGTQGDAKLRGSLARRDSYQNLRPLPTFAEHRP